MTNKSKVKGTRWESELRDFMIPLGFKVHREAQHGAKDQGDLFGIDDWTLEAKNEKRITLAKYMDELEAEIANHRTNHGAVLVKRARKSVGNSYAVMPTWRLLYLIAELRSLRKLVSDCADEPCD